MKRMGMIFSILVSFALASVAAAAPPVAEKLTIAPEASTISFVGRKVTGKHDGGFRAFTGTIELIGSDADASKVQIEIDLTSIFTDSDRLSGHLKSPDFFDVEKYPKAVFKSAKIRRAETPTDGSTHVVNASLEMHGATRPVMFPATIAIGPDSVVAKAKFSINRKEWGIAYAGKPDDLIKDEVEIAFEVRAPRKAKG